MLTLFLIFLIFISFASIWYCYRIHIFVDNMSDEIEELSIKLIDTNKNFNNLKFLSDSYKKNILELNDNLKRIQLKIKKLDDNQPKK